MKKTIIATLLFALASTQAFAVTATLPITANVGSPPITLQVDQSISAMNFKTNGKLAYLDTDPEWVASKVVFGKLKATADVSSLLQVNIPSSVVLTHSNGTDTATMALEIRYLNSGYVADKTQGAAYATTATTSASGAGYWTIIPTGITYSANNTTGGYTGNLPADINY